MKFVSILLAVGVCFSGMLQAKDLRVPGFHGGENLPIRLLKAIVEKSENYQSITYPYGEAGDASFAKTLADLRAGELDVLWTATSPEYEDQMQAIYVPIYRGTLGMRIGIIEQSKRDLFARVTTSEQFKQFVACQGKLWADTNVLEANQVRVAKSLKYPNLFAMLEGDRCDYFPRAIFEPWGEIARESQYNLMVDEHFMIRYTMPLFFFVRKDNQALAQEMTRIFDQLFEDGTFEKLFFADDDVKHALDQANLASRVRFEFTNPTVSEAVKAIPNKFWFDPLKEQ